MEGKEKKGGKTSLPSQHQEQLLLPRTCLKLLHRLQALRGSPTVPSPMLQLSSGCFSLQPHWLSFKCSERAKSFSPQGLCTGCCFCLDPILPSAFCFSFLTTLLHPSDLFTGLREGLPALGGHIPTPQRPLPLLQTFVRFVIPSLFVVASVCRA